MDITRRAFTAAATAVTLTVMGCDSKTEPAPATQSGKDKDKDKDKANLATEPFLIGEPGKYKNAGVYDEYKALKGVWLVSDGKQLVALSATCTHVGCTTNWVAETQVFKCPCHKSEFKTDGRQVEGFKAKRPLERCTLAVQDGQVRVDPTRRFRDDKGEWSDPASTLPVG
ncbi:MAG: Rieske 2Fe-2S domain-containing protein [Planctomycetes bacterium]|nr:Rieske 2Fe-2S domain-containing protein [Planctomycetota bacterium]